MKVRVERTALKKETEVENGEIGGEEFTVEVGAFLLCMS
jgi:hypothetical protein